MRIIEQNPYRQLGVFANSPTKERVANHNRLKAFLKVGKQVSFPLDLPQYLPAIERTAESVADADAKLTLPKDQLKYGQFWFVKSTPIDNIAFNHLFAGNLDDAIGLWDKKDDASSLQNRIICSIIKGEHEKALTYAQKLYADYVSQFVALILGNGSSSTTSDLSHDFLDVLCEEVGTYNILKYLEGMPDDEWKEHVRKTTLAPVISKIQSAIASAKGCKDKSPTECLAEGNKLIVITKPLLIQLQKLLPTTDIQYQMIADKLGCQILQCSIYYYNATSDADSPFKTMEMMRYARSIVVGDVAVGRCDSNMKVVQEAIDCLPPREVVAEHEAIEREMDKFMGLPEKIEHSVSLLNNTKTHLQSMKSKLGAKNAFYLKVSTRVVRNALYNVIQEVNNVQKQSLSEIISMLRRAWAATLIMDGFDMEAEYKTMYDENRGILSGLCSRFGVSTTTKDTSIIYVPTKSGSIPPSSTAPIGKKPTPQNSQQGSSKPTQITSKSAPSSSPSSQKIEVPFLYHLIVVILIEYVWISLAVNNVNGSFWENFAIGVGWSALAWFILPINLIPYYLAEYIYKSIVRLFRKSHSVSTISGPAFEKKTHTSTSTDDGKSRISGCAVFLLVLLVVAAIYAYNHYCTSHHSAEHAEKEFVEQVEEREGSTSVRPSTGDRPYLDFYGYGRTGDAWMTFMTSGQNDYVVIVKNYYTEKVMGHVYIRGGESAKIHLPYSKYMVFFISGTEWDNNYRINGVVGFFKKNCSITKDGPVDLEDGYIEYSLYPVSNGNLQLKGSNAKEAL